MAYFFDMLIRLFFQLFSNKMILGDIMNKLYMGIDIGSVTVKAVIVDEYDNIISSYYMDIYGSPIKSVKEVILKMKSEIDLHKYKVVSIGVTGSAKKLIGTLLNAQIIRNEIIALSVGTIKMYPDVKTIIDIGGEDSKLIIVNDGVVVDYAMNTSCNAGTGSFIEMFANKLKVNMGDLSELVLDSKSKINTINSGMVFAGSDLIHKIQEGYSKEDILTAVCDVVAQNYINNMVKGKKINSPIVFTGGVSKNLTVIKMLEEKLHKKIIVNRNSHLIGAFGMAIMARNSGIEHEFDFEINNYNLETKIANCVNCPSNCEIVTVYKNNNLIDIWGNKCNHVDKIKNV